LTIALTTFRNLKNQAPDPWWPFPNAGSGDTICAGGRETITVSVKVTGRATRGLGRTLLGAIALEKRKVSGFRFQGSGDSRKLQPFRPLLAPAPHPVPYSL